MRVSRCSSVSRTGLSQQRALGGAVRAHIRQRADRRLTLAGQSFLAGPPRGSQHAAVARARLPAARPRIAARRARSNTKPSPHAVGLRTKRLRPLEARQLLPVLRPEACDWALLDPAAWDIDVDALLQGFLRGARAHGTRVLTARGACHRAHGRRLERARAGARTARRRDRECGRRLGG